MGASPGQGLAGSPELTKVRTTESHGDGGAGGFLGIAPETPPRSLEDDPRRPQDAPRRPKTPPRRPKTAFKTRQDTPKMPQDAPKTRPRHPQDAPKHPKTWENRAPNSDPKLNPLQTSILERFGLDLGMFSGGFWNVSEWIWEAKRNKIDTQSAVCL